MARFLRFNAVGALGVGVQLASLWLLTAVVGIHYLIATPLCVALAVVHNFIWHALWTWKDREVDLAEACIRFVVANGLLSIVSNLGVTAALVAGAHAHPMVANVVAIATSGLLNFWLGDALVFR
jgi:putative flippase GtrA